MIIDQLKQANIDALRQHDSLKRSILSIVLNKVKLAEIERRVDGQPLADNDIVAILIKTGKELTEERDAFAKAGREDTVATLNLQIAFVSTFLPEMMSMDEIIAEISKLEDKTIPSVMRHFKSNFAGKCNMADVQTALKSIQ